MSEGRIIDLFTGAPVEETTPRATALKTGALVDASRRAAALGFNVPVALTRPVWALHLAGTPMGPQRDARWHAILWMAFLACAAAHVERRVEDIPFTAYVGPYELDLIAHVGPGDTAEPVITIMLPEEMPDDPAE